MNFILLGGRLSDGIASELSAIYKRSKLDVNFITFDDSNVVNKIIQKKGKNYLRNIDSIIVFDTSFPSLTEWGDLELLVERLNRKDIIIATRFPDFIPNYIQNASNVNIYKEDGELSVDKFSIKLAKYIKMMQVQAV